MAVLPGKRVRDNSIFGTITSSLSSAGTTINSVELSDLSTISGDHAIITLDPFKQNGDPEIIMVIAHPSSSTSATVQRGMYGTTARAHAVGTQWAHAATVEDFADVLTSGTLPVDSYEGQMVYQTDTDSYRYFDGVTWRTLGAGAASFLGYAQVTANQGSIPSSITDLTNLAVTVTIPEGRRIRVTGHAASWLSTVADGRVVFYIREGGTVLNDIVQAMDPSAGQGNGGGQVVWVGTPTAGTHTYKLSAQGVDGGESLTLEATATGPAFILVEDITGSESPHAAQNVPVGLLAQAQITANSNTFTTTPTNITGLSVNVVVPAGRLLEIAFHGLVNNNTIDAATQLQILEDGVQISLSQTLINVANNSDELDFSFVRSPAAGMHTYQIRGVTVAGTAFVRADPTFPAQIIVTDVTSTPTPSSGAPSSTLAYTQNTALSQVVVATAADLSGLSVNITVPDGRRLKITGHVYVETGAGAPTAPFMQIMEGATRLQLAQHYGGTAPDLANTLECSAIISPTAGSHTYKLQGGAGAGDTVTFLSGSNFPAFILVEDITGSIWPQGSQVTSGIIASEQWTDFTPTLTQAVDVTKTVNYARYTRIGRTIHAQVLLTVTGAGTAANAVVVGLPVTAAIADINSGGGTIYDSSANLRYKGLAELGTTTLKLFNVGDTVNNFLGATGFVAGLATGDLVRLGITYEAAS